MFSVTDTALDRLVLELLLHGVGVGVLRLVLRVLAPVGAEAEDDVLADRRRVGLGAGAVLLGQAKLGPGLALGHARVHDLAVCHEADAASRLHFLAVVV